MQQLTPQEQKVYEIVSDYRQDDNPLEAVSNVVHDFDMMMSDVWRGRVENDLDENKAWYNAYEILCARAGVVPVTVKQFFSGHYIGSHRGEMPVNDYQLEADDDQNE